MHITPSDTGSDPVQSLTFKVKEQEDEIQRLQEELSTARKGSNISTSPPLLSTECQNPNRLFYSSYAPRERLLTADEYRRYGRQMILPEISLQGQLSLRNAAVLVVGVGGLGCPAATYLAGAGVGTLGLVDGDTVELSNLHRQFLHTTGRVGKLKVESAAEQLRQLNPEVNYKLHPEHLSPDSALDIFAEYDLVLDCTDHPTSRYLISDAAVLSGIPLVSGSALRADGQLLVLNHPQSKPGEDAPRGPCYRCVFPKPPPAESVISCGDGGILGPVVGVMGVLMAVEAIKLLVSRNPPLSLRRTPESGPDSHIHADQQVSPPSMLIYSAFSSPPFRSLRLHSARPDCSACSARATITSDALRSNKIDYAAFCGMVEPVRILDSSERLTASELGEEIAKRLYISSKDSGTENEAWASPGGDPPNEIRPKSLLRIVDVRDAAQFEICHLPGSINIPLSALESYSSPQTQPQHPHGESTNDNNAGITALVNSLTSIPASSRIVTVCRLGNDSQLAARKLQEIFRAKGNQGGVEGEEQEQEEEKGEGEGKGRRLLWIGDLAGGFEAWRRDVDPTWPQY